MWLENILVHEHLWRRSTQIEYSSQMMAQQASMKTFVAEYLLYTKSNRTEIQTYKVEERTFGTPCIYLFSNISLKVKQTANPVHLP